MSRPAYYPVSDFPDLQEICRKWVIIKNEFLQLNAPVMNIDRQGKCYDDVIANILHDITNGKQYGWVKGWGKDEANDDWLQFGLSSFDESVNEILKPKVIEKVPETYQMINRLNGIKIAAFVKLKAHSMLHCHIHSEIFDEGLLQFHLPIVTATERNYAYLNVSGEFRQHKSGEAIIFDGSLDHFAINESDVDRTILYLEFKK